jgi:hypothetical protein
MKKIKVYCGETIQEKCGMQLHPIQEVKNAAKTVMSSNDEVVYSNNTDFIGAIQFIAIKNNVAIEFFLNGVSVGDDIEPIFADLNRGFDLLYE